MGKPIIHLYTVAWNEIALLEFFFRHYDKFVDKYIYYDDNSDDGSLEILNAHPKVEVRKFPRVEEDSYVLSAQILHDNCWKESIGVADWVILMDVDEFLYHPNLIEYLIDCKSKGISVIPALGYQMISDFFPESGTELIEVVPDGAPWDKMNKFTLFDPALVEKSNCSIGRHIADPKGKIKYPEKDELLNLHYKYLGIDYTLKNHHALNTKTGRNIDKENKWGFRYDFTREELKKDIDVFRVNLVSNVIDKSKKAHYTHSKLQYRWWRKEEARQQKILELQKKKKKKKAFMPWYFVRDRLPEGFKSYLDRMYIKLTSTKNKS